MGDTHTVRWESIERWSPTLFLIGGVLLVGHAVMLGIDAFSSLSTPPDLFGPSGHLMALLGLFGLYPMLTDRTPAVTRIAGGVALLGIGSWAVLTVTRLLTVAGLVSSVSEMLPPAFFGLVFLATIITYVLFGIATIRADGEAGFVSGLLFAPAALLVVALLGSAITDLAAVAGFFVACGLALSILSLGYVLRTWDRPVRLDVPSGDVSMR